MKNPVLFALALFITACGQRVDTVYIDGHFWTGNEAQPAASVMAVDDGRWAEERVGPDRLKTTYAFNDILKAGGILTFGSDWPVAPLSPLGGVYAAVTRQTTDGKDPEGWLPDQKISFEAALRAYTASNAYAFGDEETLGSLEIGKLADFVVLSDNLFEIEPTKIPDVLVHRTVINGESVFERPQDP